MSWLNVILNWLVAAKTWTYAHEDLTAGLLTAAILLVALIIAKRQLRSMRDDRHASIALNIRRDYDSGTVLEGRRLTLEILNQFESEKINDRPKSFMEIVENYKKSSPEKFMHLTSVPALFDHIGWIVRNKCCEAQTIDEQLPWEKYFDLWEIYIRKIQEKKNKEELDDKPTTMYGNFVWLANELKKQRK